MQLRYLMKLSKLFFISYVFLVKTLVFSSESEVQPPHLLLPSPSIRIEIQHNQAAPLSPLIEMGVREGATGGVVNSFVITANQSNDSPPSSFGDRQSTPSSDAVVAISINPPGGRRGALIPEPMTQERLERLIKCGKALGKRTPHPLPASDSVFENIMGVPTFKALLTTKKGVLGLSAVMALLFVSYDITNSNQAVLEFKFFREICGLENYYPYQAMQNGNLAGLAATGPLYLFMFPALMISYGALCHDVCKKRLPALVKGCCRQEENKLLRNPENACLITFSSIVSAFGSGTIAMAKLYGFYQLIQYAGTSWGDKAQLFSYSYHFLSTFYTLFDTSTTYIHSKIHQRFNRDDQITASNRSTLLNITQNAITKWLILSEHEKIQSYNQYFVPKAGDTDVRRFYRMLFFLFDFGQIDVLIQRQAEPKTRKALRLASDGVAAATGYFSFGYIQHGVQSLLDGTLNYFGVQDYDKSITQKTATGLASIGSCFTVAIARNIGKAIVQGYDAWSGYRNIDEVASSLYANTYSGQTSHPKLRKYLTTYNQINGAFLSISELHPIC